MAMELVTSAPCVMLFNRKARVSSFVESSSGRDRGLIRTGLGFTISFGGAGFAALVAGGGGFVTTLAISVTGLVAGTGPALVENDGSFVATATTPFVATAV